MKLKVTKWGNVEAGKIIEVDAEMGKLLINNGHAEELIEKKVNEGKSDRKTDSTDKLSGSEGVAESNAKQ